MSKLNILNLCFVTVIAPSNTLITVEKKRGGGKMKHDLDIHILTHGTPTSKLKIKTHKQTYIISWSVVEWGGQNILQKGFTVAMTIEEEAHFWIFTVHHHPHLEQTDITSTSFILACSMPQSLCQKRAHSIYLKKKKMNTMTTVHSIVHSI